MNLLIISTAVLFSVALIESILIARNSINYFKKSLCIRKSKFRIENINDIPTSRLESVGNSTIWKPNIATFRSADIIAIGYKFFDFHFAFARSTPILHAAIVQVESGIVLEIYLNYYVLFLPLLFIGVIFSWFSIGIEGIDLIKSIAILSVVAALMFYLLFLINMRKLQRIEAYLGDIEKTNISTE